MEFIIQKNAPAEDGNVDIKLEVEEQPDEGLGSGGDLDLSAWEGKMEGEEEKEEFGVRRLQGSLPVPVLERTRKNGVKNCLICFKTTYLTSKDLKLTKQELLPLRRDKWVLFILKEVVRMPEEKLQEYLCHPEMKKPRTWLSFCCDCVPVVSDAIKLQMNIEELSKKLGAVKEKIRSEIKVSFRMKRKGRTARNKTKPSLRLTREARNFVATGTNSLDSLYLFKVFFNVHLTCA